MRWLDFHLRFIQSKPRSIILSNKFPMRLPASVEAGLHRLEKVIMTGDDLNPYQYKTLFRFHDVSGKQRAKRTDLMWADWQVHHLHLTDINSNEGDYFSPRACGDGESFLLFCIVTEDAIGFINIKKHSNDYLFSDKSIMETAISSWPDYFKSSQLVDVMPGDEGYSNREIAELRKAGLTSTFQTGGKVYALGGVSGASTSTIASLKSNKILRWIKT